MLAFDGSASGDSTALVGCTLDGHVFVEGLWENPNDTRWRVPREDVADAIDLAFAKYNVVELACDPWGWRTEIEAGQKHGEKRVIEWNTCSRAAHGAGPPIAYIKLSQRVTSRMTVTRDWLLTSLTASRNARLWVSLVSRISAARRARSTHAVAAIVAYDRAAWHLHRNSSRTGSFE